MLKYSFGFKNQYSFAMAKSIVGVSLAIGMVAGCDTITMKHSYCTVDMHWITINTNKFIKFFCFINMYNISWSLCYSIQSDYFWHAFCYYMFMLINLVNILQSGLKIPFLSRYVKQLKYIKYVWLLDFRVKT